MTSALPTLSKPAFALCALAIVIALPVVVRAQVTEPAPAPAASQPLAEPAAEPSAVATEPVAGPAPEANVRSGPAPSEPPPAPSAAPAGETGSEVSDADVEAVLTQSSDESAAAIGADTPTLNLYGFADFQFLGELRNSDPRFGESAFSVGSLNLYADANLTRGFRSLVEIRFMYLPSGSLDFETFRRTKTLASDHTSVGRPISWGSISIQRAWLEYNLHSLLTIRAGSWLTPVGIWNVDHGTPAIIPAWRPFVIGDGVFPERQTGLELYGSGLLGETTLGYHLTLSNGRAPFEYLDLDTNKGVGGRLFATFVPLGTLSLGASGYAGKYTDATVGIGADMMLDAVILEQYDELSYGVDLLWQWEGVHLQAEWLGRDVAFNDEGRIRAPPPLPQTGVVPDYRKWGAYVLVGYRLPWWQGVSVMPFFMLEAIAHGRGSAVALGGANSVNVAVYGVNVRPVPAVALKVQYHHGTVVRAGEDLKLSTIVGSAAWSF
jgi:hypothetical protein